MSRLGTPFYPRLIGLGAVAVYRYLDTLYFGITADHDAVPDPNGLASGIMHELAQLACLAGLTGSGASPGRMPQSRSAA